MPASRRIRVRGTVQGVGFRPFVYRLARELGLDGWVRNDGEGVEIAARGSGDALDALLARLNSEAPPLARIDGIESRETPAEPTPKPGFAILHSHSGSANTAVTPDAATCPDCLAELLNPDDRRYRYPFINCTHCGPRYTLTARLPYDRPNTSMAEFVLCPACRAEYENPLDRRFHAQPNACPACGPRLALLDATGHAISCGDAIAECVSRLLRGEILAVKGLGGFHLMCDARNGATVAELRRRKQREAKPFAVLAANPASLAPFAVIDDQAKALLEARERPIVLLAKSPPLTNPPPAPARGILAGYPPPCGDLGGTGEGRVGARVPTVPLPGIAEGVAWLGAMLPYTPLHWLLFHEAAGRPAGTAWLEDAQELLLVCTSANPGGEPLVTGNGEALARLSGIADAFLMHDRGILVGCDDSVVGSRDEDAVFIRRARGYAPRPIKLPHAGASVLACGGWYKNTVCLTRGGQAFVSQHIGDLDNAAACRAMEAAVAHLLEVLEIRPEIVACDLHPDFHGSRFAAAFAAAHNLPLVAVQHHHAHLAAVLAEHGFTRPALGLALDGVGLGSDGHAWGGELLRLEDAGFERLGHLRELRLPGGDRAAREPWRMAASALYELGRGADIERRYAAFPAAATVAQMLERGINAPPASSCGRLFDAAAGLLGILPVMDFEGQAAMRLESLAAWHGEVAPLARGWRVEADGALSFLPLLAELAETGDAGRGAALFHATLAEGLAHWVATAARRHGLNTVALGGGCFLNAILGRELRGRLQGEGMNVLEARQVPPNDGGLSLGQAWVARQAG